MINAAVCLAFFVAGAQAQFSAEDLSQLFDNTRGGGGGPAGFDAVFAGPTGAGSSARAALEPSKGLSQLQRLLYALKSPPAPTLYFKPHNSGPATFRLSANQVLRDAAGSVLSVVFDNMVLRQLILKYAAMGRVYVVDLSRGETFKASAQSLGKGPAAKVLLKRAGSP